MKTIALLLLTALSLHAQETKQGSAPAAETAKPAAAVTPEMEAKFKTTLTNAVMDGRFCMIAGGKLSPDKEEKYTIAGVEKTGDAQWTITAKIEYAGITLNAPVPVQVKWAGDTAVIIVDNMGFPGTAKYSARVMIHGDTYAGTWNGGDHGGLLHGVIKKAEEKK